MRGNRALWSGALRSALALSAWAGVHSLLAWTQIRELARARLGEDRTNGLYRLGYNAFAIASFGGLLGYVWRLPDRRLYTARGALRVLMLAGQAGCAAGFLSGVLQVGLGLFLGVTQAWDLITGKRPISPTPVAQHPLPREGSDDVGWTGPYRLSRHPSNYFVILGFWLSPVMTLKWGAFGLVTAVYMFLGSRHEGWRLTQAYGERYLRYRERVPHFPLPFGRATRHE
ncbi:MAG: hypothetical protein M3Q29_01825 [Chloroflexota bacterium]|nr:hypothetical protein [Chloroflexota bacterium]